MPKIFKSANVTMYSEKVNIGVVDPLTFMVKKDILKDNKQVDKKELEENIPKKIKEVTNSKEADKIIQDAKKAAEEIIKKAKEEAEKIKINFEKESTSHLKVLEDKSSKDGYEKGYSKGVLEIEQMKAETLEILGNAKEERNKEMEDLEPQIIDLLVNILDKLFYKTIAINRGVIVNLIKQGLEDSNLGGDVIIKVSVEDYPVVLKSKEDIISLADSSSNIEIIKDSSLNPSDCIIETSYGNIDCSLDEQFKLLKENIYFILENR